MDAPSEQIAQARRFAAELRRIIEKLVTIDAPAEELSLGADAAAAFADRLEAEFPRRRSWYEVAETAVAEIADVSEIATDRAAGGFFDRSPIVGLSNPLASPLTLEIAQDASGHYVKGSATFTAAYEGPPGNVHGGMVAAAFDEVLGMAQALSGNAGFTGTLTIRYRSPTPLHEPLSFRGWVTGTERRKIFTSGTCHAGDRLTAEAEGIFITVDRTKFEELLRQRAEKTTGAARSAAPSETDQAGIER